MSHEIRETFDRRGKIKAFLDERDRALGNCVIKFLWREITTKKKVPRRISLQKISTQ